jgi:hypothetical protein
MAKKAATPKPAPAPKKKPVNPFEPVDRIDLPLVVRYHAESTGKVPLHAWYENEGKTLAIQWTDFSKDRFEVS